MVVDRQRLMYDGVAPAEQGIADTSAKGQGLGLSSLRNTLTCHPSPKTRASGPGLVRRAEAGKEVGQAPTKALVRGLLLPPPSF